MANGLKRILMERVREVIPLKHLLVVVFLHCTAMYMTVPAVVDVTMIALCQQSEPCDRAIYLTGLQQVATGIGAMIMTPMFGSLSDRYGRKPLFLFIFTISILPYAVLSYDRSKEFVYMFYVADTISSVVVDGSVQCLTLAYVADCVDGHSRSSCIGTVSGIISLGYVFSTFLARLISETRIFQVAALLTLLSAVYVKVFLTERLVLYPPVEEDEVDSTELIPSSPGSSRKAWIRCLGDPFVEIASSPLLVQVTIITFFCAVADAGLQSVLWYYLRSVFDFGKDEFSEMMLISGSASVFLQFFVMPFLVPMIGEKKILIYGLLGDLFHAILYGIAWAPWVPYFSASAAALTVVIYSSISVIVSKEAPMEQQGKIQGVVSGVRSLATIIAPLAVTPLSALFFSDHAPFHCRGFSILCLAFSLLIAVIQACLLKKTAPPLNQGTQYIQIKCEDSYSSMSLEEDRSSSKPRNSIYPNKM